MIAVSSIAVTLMDRAFVHKTGKSVRKVDAIFATKLKVFPCFFCELLQHNILLFCQ